MSYFDWVMSGVPKHTQQSLEDYFCRCYHPGEFVYAVLMGDLFTAATKADHKNSEALGDIARWVYLNAPAHSFGSEATIDGWLSKNKYQQAFEKSMIVKILQT